MTDDQFDAGRNWYQELLLSRDGEVLKQIPTAAREVYDVSGAGDTSIAALVLAAVALALLPVALAFATLPATAQAPATATQDDLSSIKLNLDALG